MQLSKKLVSQLQQCQINSDGIIKNTKRRMASVENMQKADKIEGEGNHNIGGRGLDKDHNEGDGRGRDDRGGGKGCMIQLVALEIKQWEKKEKKKS